MNAVLLHLLTKMEGKPHTGTKRHGGRLREFESVQKAFGSQLSGQSVCYTGMIQIPSTHLRAK